MAVDVDHAAAGGIYLEDFKVWEWIDDKYRLHRADGPARMYLDGRREWWYEGQSHRDGGPAVINGTEEIWYWHGQRHRDSGPAWTMVSGTKIWYRHGRRHRMDGPAYVWKDGRAWWMVNDRDITGEVVEWMHQRGCTLPFTPEQQAEFALRWG